MAVTFDTLTLPKPRITEVDYPGQTGEVVLANGKTAQDLCVECGTVISIQCYTETITDIDDAKAKYGVLGTLAIGSTNIKNMTLVSVSVRPIETYTKFIYTLKFRKDTAEAET